ncbi:MAG: hypothetical protein HZY73_04655 [Micropruina sp.]|nr:MAG: hypothetical protein HZY73_04655 [Micropruina sp.]
MDRPGTNSASDAPDPVAALYARDPDEFVAARTALVSAARQAGDKELAKRLGMLKRPTRSAWLVNLLHHADPGVAARLADLAHRLGRRTRPWTWPGSGLSAASGPPWSTISRPARWSSVKRPATPG